MLGGYMSDSDTTISTRRGAVRGLQQNGVNRFLGIRYAAAPVGKLRFQPPQPYLHDADHIDATTFGGRHFQIGWPEEVLANIEIHGEESEDNLFLNVFTPADMSDSKPVLVWIHGGAFMCGSGNDYDPSNIVRDNDVVVVTINYRLGIFGFLNLADLGAEFAGSANLGIQDQIAALQWVSDNIEDYGGDTSNISIFGESAGAASVLALMGAPAAGGLFHKAMPFSGAETLAPATDQLTPIKAVLGCDSNEECLEKLKQMPAEELSQLQVQSGIYVGPSQDGVVLTRPTCEAIKDGGAAGIPVLTGATRDEGTLLAPAFVPTAEIGAAMVFALSMSIGRDDGAAYRDYLGSQVAPEDVLGQMTQAWFDTFRSSALRVAATASQHGAGGWVYNFEVETDHELGITHFADVPFTFNWIEEGNPALFVHPPTAINQQLALQWSSTVVEFAKTGSPNGHGLPQWPQYTAETQSCLWLSQEPMIVHHPDGDMPTICRVAETSA